MLKITIPAIEFWDEANNEFIIYESRELTFEHSLLSLKKWESKWHKPYLDPNTKLSEEESIDYYRCMCLDRSIDPKIFFGLDRKTIKILNDYIDDPQSAITLPKKKHTPLVGEIVTAEIIYYWMISLNIPFECEKWHLNSLLSLIRVCEIKNTPPKKRATNEIIEERRAINEARRKKYNSKG